MNCDRNNIEKLSSYGIGYSPFRRFFSAFTFTFLLFYSAINGIAQSTSGSIDQLAEGLNGYFDKNLQEKIYVHTDRDCYLTGETMWFKIYYVDATYNRPLNVSKVAYLEIVDKNNESVSQTVVSIDDSGVGNGSLFIPSSVTSGNYTFRAYTSWMKNFDPEFYFLKTLMIINPFSRLTLPDFNAVRKFDVQFFPEGGDLVCDLSSTVAFKAVDQSGRGVDFKGVVIDGTGDTVTHITNSKFGIGNFKLKPLTGHSYKAIVEIEGKKLSIDLPAARDFGYVMKVTEGNSKNVNVMVEASYGAGVAKENEDVYLLIHAGQKIINLSKATFDNSNKVTFSINKGDLMPGVSRFTIFNKDAMPVCERSFFKQPDHFFETTLSTDRNSYSVRSKITINGASKDLADKASISLSIHKMDSLNSPSTSIYNYLWLTSELKGRIEYPQYYFEGPSTEEKISMINNLMLIHGWSRFNWDRIVNGNSQNKYYPEILGPLVTGQLNHKSMEQPAKYRTIWVSSPGIAARPHEAMTDSVGVFKFELGNARGIKSYVTKVDRVRDSLKQKEQLDMLFEHHDLEGIKVYLSKIDTIDNSDPIEIKLFSSFSDEFSSYKPEEFDLSESVEGLIHQRSLHMQVANIFPNKTQRYFSNINTVSFYGEAPYRYILDDYTRFPTMEEVLREYVPRLVVRKREGKFNFRIVDDLQSTVFTKLPLVLLDGVPVFDINKLMEFDPLRVDKLEIISRKYYLGESSFEGVVSFFTYKGDFEGFDDADEKIVQNLQGLQERREFYSPKYDLTDRQDSRTPDVRNLLFWDPSIVPGADGKFSVEFYSSDIAGKYVVEVQGMDTEGRCTESKTYFSVSGQGVN